MKLVSSVTCRRFLLYEIGYYERVISSFKCLRVSGDRYDVNNRRIGTDIEKVFLVPCKAMHLCLVLFCFVFSFGYGFFLFREKKIHI